MIQELVALSKILREKNQNDEITHDALKKEPIDIDCVIDKNGAFIEFIAHEKMETITEAIPAKKGKARLLVDKAEEVICYNGEISQKKHTLFLQKLELYKDIKELEPVRLFYTHKKLGIQKAQTAFTSQIKDKQRGGNIAFIVKGENTRLHEKSKVIQAIIRTYEAGQKQEKSNIICSVCNSNKYPIIDSPHGMIKKVPKGQTAGCALVSYNEKAYESYKMNGNINSSICTHCAKAYVESLNWLLSSSRVVLKETKKSSKESFEYTNRKNLGDDTAAIFWTQSDKSIDEVFQFDAPDTDTIHNLFASVKKGKKSLSKIDTELFYSITLSSAAARIAVRDFIQTSLSQFKVNICAWFKDIAIDEYNKTLKKCSLHYPALYQLSFACCTEKKSSTDLKARVGTLLWKSAIRNAPVPIWVLAAVLQRTHREQGNIKAAHASLIRLILNRNPINISQGGIYFMESLDSNNQTPAYICGRIFALLDSIQYHALGSEINAGIKDRYFSSASTTPSLAFGRLMKLSQHHLSKIRSGNPGLFVNLDKKLQDLCASIDQFPTIFTLEEQGAFALGYYHQRQKNFESNSNEN